MMYQNGSELFCRHFDSRLGGRAPLWRFSLADSCAQLQKSQLSGLVWQFSHSKPYFCAYASILSRICLPYTFIKQSQQKQYGQSYFIA